MSDALVLVFSISFTTLFPTSQACTKHISINSHKSLRCGTQTIAQKHQRNLGGGKKDRNALTRETLKKSLAETNS